MDKSDIETTSSLIVHPDEYKCYRSTFIQAGFFWGILIIVFGFDHAVVNIHNFWPLLLLIFEPFIMVVYQRGTFIKASDKEIQIGDLLKTKFAPEDLRAVSYESRPNSIGMVFEYEKDGRTLSKSLAGDWFNTASILRLNDTLKRLHPNLPISIDEKARQGLEKRKNLHLKKPTSAGAWIVFALSWFLLGFLFISAVFWFIHHL